MSQKNKIAKFKAKHTDTRGMFAAKKKLKRATKKQERNVKRGKKGHSVVAGKKTTK